MKQRVQAISKQFMLEVDRGGVWVLKGVDGDVQIGGYLAESPRDGKKPLQDTAVFGRSCGTQTLRFSVPVSGESVVAWAEDLVKDVVHGLHQIVARSVIGREVHVAFGASREPQPRDGRKIFLVLLSKGNEGVRSRNFTVV